MRTCQGLMKLMNIEFHFERLSQNYRNKKTIETVLVLMARAKKMYEAVGSLLTIFKLMDTREMY